MPHKIWINNGDKVLICFFLLNHLRFYNLAYYSTIAGGYLRYIIDICFACFFFYCFLLSKSKGGKFERSVLLVYLVFLCSFFTSFIGGLNIVYWLRGAAPMFLPFGFFYYLKYKKIPINTVHSILLYLLLGYLLIQFICYIQYPNSWWGIASWESDSVDKLKNDSLNRGVIRFVLPCKMLIPLFIFYIFMKESKKRTDYLYLFLLFICLLLIGNRFPLLVTIIILFFLVLFSNRMKFINKLKVTLFSLITLGLCFFIPFTNNTISSLIKHSESEYNDYGDKNVRILSTIYFFTEFNEGNLFNTIFGNGVVVPNSNSYSKKTMQLQDDYQFYSSDVGYCLIFLYFGVIGLITLLIWFVSSLRVNAPPQYRFIKVYFVFIMISMFAGGYWFENLVIMAMLSYILSIATAQLDSKRAIIKYIKENHE